MDTEGTAFAAVAETTSFLHYFSGLPDHRQASKVDYPLPEVLLLISSGGSCGGGGIHRHRAIWRAEDRTAAAISALCKRHALARSSRRYLCHA